MSEQRCEATLEIGDDYGDNHATMHCQLSAKHDGPHQEKYIADSSQDVTVTWMKRQKAKL